MKTSEEIIVSVGHIGNLQRLLITAVLIIAPFIVYYAAMIGVYAADNIIHMAETGQHLPMSIPAPSPYPWYYMSLSAGALLGFVWAAIGVKYFKQLK